ncbi:MAG: hypothetical protein ACK4YQ_17935 [Phenylobacterium sp.]|uniref:hypothetical protein n=1 Tax=Phenylobacterium sp. TaxID=1871053 RepID=UPI00391D46E7
MGQLALLPPSTNADYRGAAVSAHVLAVAAVLTIIPGLIHSFAPSGGAEGIAGLQLGAQRELVVSVFAWMGAAQIAYGLAMLAAALRYRPLVPMFFVLILVERGLMALQGWVLKAPASGHHPPEHYASLAVLPIAAVFLVLSLRARAGA